MDITETLTVKSAAEWREWLIGAHDKRREIWLVFYKKASGKQSIEYREAVEEATCFGWIDSQMKSIDHEKYALRFTPRRANSSWTEGNLELARQLVRSGRMSAAGLSSLPDGFMSE